MIQYITEKNVFSIIKKIENRRKEYITKYKSVINEIKYLKIKDASSTNIDLINAYDKKKCILSTILLLKSAYSIIDQIFQREIENAEKITAGCCANLCYNILGICCCCFKNSSCCKIEYDDPNYMNSFISSVMDPFSNWEDIELNNIQHSDNIKKQRKKNCCCLC